MLCHFSFTRKYLTGKKLADHERVSNGSFAKFRPLCYSQQRALTPYEQLGSDA